MVELTLAYTEISGIGQYSTVQAKSDSDYTQYKRNRIPLSLNIS